MYLSENFNIVGLTPDYTPFPFCLSSRLLALIKIFGIRTEEEMQQNVLSLKSVLLWEKNSQDWVFPIPSYHAQDF